MRNLASASNEMEEQQDMLINELGAEKSALFSGSKAQANVLLITTLEEENCHGSQGEEADPR